MTDWNKHLDGIVEMIRKLKAELDVCKDPDECSRLAKQIIDLEKLLE